MNTPNEQLPEANPEHGRLYASSSIYDLAIEPQIEDPDNPPWTVFSALGLWLLSVLLVNIVPLIFLGPYFLIRYPGLQNLPQPLFADRTATLLVVLSLIPTHLLTFGAVWYVVKRSGKRSFWRAFGWSWSARFGFWTSTGLAIALLLIGAVVAKKLGGGQPTDIDRLIDTSTTVRITLAILAATSGPIVEELVYRGVLYSALNKALGSFGSVVIVSLLFALVHVGQYWDNFGVLAVILMLSVTLTVVRAWTGRLLPCFIIHMVFNGIQSVLIVFHPYVEQFEKGLQQKTGLVMMFWRVFCVLT